MKGQEEAPQESRPFAILPGVGIGPFRLGMTEGEVDNLCREHGLRNDGVFHSGLAVEFQNGCATRITFEADMGLSLAGEPLMDTSDRNVRRLLASVTPPGPDWMEMEGLVVFHEELSDDWVFAFMVYSPGHRYPV